MCNSGKASADDDVAANIDKVGELWAFVTNFKGDDDVADVVEEIAAFTGELIVLVGRTGDDGATAVGAL